MTNRSLTHIIKDQHPLVVPVDETVRKAAKAMLERGAGSVLVVDGDRVLKGIFTGRDAIRLLAEGRSTADVVLAEAMTTNPVTVTTDHRAIDALKAMDRGGFRHIPVLRDDRIFGCVSRGDFKGMEFEAYHWHLAGRPVASPPNRPLGDIVRGQKPLELTEVVSLKEACSLMWKQRRSIALVVDAKQKLKGVFTGRDGLKALAKLKAPAAAKLSKAMTRNPTTITADRTAIDALRMRSDGGFRHLPVVDGDRILGVVARADFTGCEIDRLEEEEHLCECIW